MGSKVHSAGRAGALGLPISLSFSLPLSDFSNSSYGREEGRGLTRRFALGRGTSPALALHGFFCAGQFRNSCRDLLLSVHNTPADLIMMSLGILQAQRVPGEHIHLVIQPAWAQGCSVSCRCSQELVPRPEPHLHS